MEATLQHMVAGRLVDESQEEASIPTELRQAEIGAVKGFHQKREDIGSTNGTVDRSRKKAPKNCWDTKSIDERGPKLNA